MVKRIQRPVFPSDSDMFRCSRCDTGAGIATVIKHKIYCSKCADIVQGKRYPNGKLKKEEVK